MPSPRVKRSEDSEGIGATIRIDRSELLESPREREACTKAYKRLMAAKTRNHKAVHDLFHSQGTRELEVV